MDRVLSVNGRRGIFRGRDAKERILVRWEDDLAKWPRPALARVDTRFEKVMWVRN